MKNAQIKLADCTLEQYTETLIRGNGFGHESMWIKSYFGEQPFGIVEETPGIYIHNVCQYTFDEFFKSMGFTKIAETYYDDSGEVAVTYENLEVELNKYVRIYKNAMLIFKGNDEKETRICVCINNYGPREISYRLYAPTTHDDLLKKWFDYAKEHSFYHGKKLDADLRFLKIKEVTWDDVILPTRTIKVVKNNINELFEMREFLKINDIPLKAGIILAGPPGTGKTVLCKILANEMPATVLYAMPDHMGQTHDVKSVCEMAKNLAPCLMIIEDIDYIAEEREYSRNAGGVMELMNYLDGIQEFSDVITLATTNAVDKLEAAIKNRPGRFDRVIKIPRPDEDCRLKMFKKFTEKYIIKDVNFDSLVKETDELSGAHIKDICKTAARNAGREKSYDDKKIAIVDQTHFDKALKEVKNIDYASHFKEKRKTMGFNDPSW